jgi:hypothetical protein
VSEPANASFEQEERPTRPEDRLEAPRPVANDGIPPVRRSVVSSALRQLHDSVAKEPLPEEMLRLLKDIEDRAGGGAR